MAELDYLTLLGAELDRFAGCLDGDLAAPVPDCGDWTLYDLANHLGAGNLWAAVAVTEKHGRHSPPPAPRAPDALAAWFAGSCATLLTTLAADPATEAWTFFPPHTVGFWRRRRTLETLVHRWEAAHALGRPAPLDPALAADGVAEVFDTMAPRQVKRGRAAAPANAVRFTTADSGDSWVYGPGEPVAQARGTAADLLLMLWNRLPATDPAISWTGDRAAAAAVLDGPLVP
ncbi:MAG TPA: maleylpyruvate isomerase family mycothiol-dependent enzyme [Rugosimonospora sp.]|nr:maleylpyruvate isomerase family mycothiol-dependent enzyme [Rugosimonospora sp.]